MLNQNVWDAEVRSHWDDPIRDEMKEHLEEMACDDMFKGVREVLTERAAPPIHTIRVPVWAEPNAGDEVNVYVVVITSTHDATALGSVHFSKVDADVAANYIRQVNTVKQVDVIKRTIQ